MNGSLALRGGILHVARHARTAEIRLYDFDGGRIAPGFDFAGENGGRASADGIAVDADMRVWVADRASAAVRSFTVFGTELARLPAHARIAGVAAIADPCSVAISGVEGDTRIWVASRGVRRHACVQFDRAGNLVHALRSMGDPETQFRDVVRLSVSGRFALACESGSGLVQMFRDGEFHFALRVPRPRGARADPLPRAALALSDGRCVVATGGEGTGAVHVFDANGRLVSTLAVEGRDTGSVFEPTDLALVESSSDRRSRLAVIDCDGDRVQVFTLEGVCYGAFEDFDPANRAGAGGGT